jgi:5-methylcytosine-specific restriction endonuclease McrA
LDDFGLQVNGKTKRGYCKPCDSAQAREWQRANPARHAANKHAAFVRAAKQFNVWKLDGSMDGLYHPYGRALQGDPCAYCGRDAGHLDHIVPRGPKQRGEATKRTEWDNLTAACHLCNIHKERASLLEFLAWPRGWLTST